ncbi:MAG: metal-dependent hydrolase [Thermaerobacter sp.]|nr:metal-dependent hydrolase [Thermaerobacter sp.]
MANAEGIALNGTCITWLGHAAFLIETSRGRRLVMDPFLTHNPMCPDGFRHIDAADVITVSHGHSDHMEDAAAIGQRTGAPIVANYEIASYLQDVEGAPATIGMNKGGTVEVAGLRLTMVEAVHSSGIATPEGQRYGGEAAGFVVELEDGLTLYHAGDTNVFSDMRLIHDLYAPAIALLPIGGHFTMAPKEAAYAVRLLGPQVVIPMHYGTFPPLTGTPAALADLVGDQARVVALQPGESYA